MEIGDRVYAFCPNTSLYYLATVLELETASGSALVEWDDDEPSQQRISLDHIMEAPLDMRPWSKVSMERRATICESPHKGRCLFAVEERDVGQVIMIEKPLLVSKPGVLPWLWKYLQHFHQAQPLSLGSICFYYAALVSYYVLSQTSLDILLDKFVPNPDEDPSSEIHDVLASLEKSPDAITDARPPEAKLLHRLVNVWRYNSFDYRTTDSLAIFEYISSCAHSCDPSCSWQYGLDGSFVLRARRSLRLGDELTVSYLGDEELLKSIVVRRERLLSWEFTCSCERCSASADSARGFRCWKCRRGVMLGTAGHAVHPCNTCKYCPTQDETDVLLSCEQEYIDYLEYTDTSDTDRLSKLFNDAFEVFDRHWFLFALDSLLYRAYDCKRPTEALEHHRRRIQFHEICWCRPTLSLAEWHEELGDILKRQFPKRSKMWVREFDTAYQLFGIMCGINGNDAERVLRKLSSARCNDIHSSKTNALAGKTSAWAATIPNHTNFFCKNSWMHERRNPVAGRGTSSSDNASESDDSKDSSMSSTLDLTNLR